MTDLPVAPLVPRYSNEEVDPEGLLQRFSSANDFGNFLCNSRLARTV
jgi:hypothetical protein